MEIDELKDIWRKESEGFARRNERELATMLKGKSSSIVSRLKRNVWIELSLTVLGGVGLLGYAMMLPDGYLKSISISILILFCLYAFYYLKKLRLLIQFDPGNDNLKGNLHLLITNLKGYLRFYKRSYTILYPVYFLLGILFSAIERGATGFISQISRTEVLIPLLLGAFVFFICSTWLTSWYLKKLYGNHLEKLEGVLRELEIQ
jgi:hypothetical protein